MKNYHKKKLLLLLTIAMVFGILSGIYGDSNFSNDFLSIKWFDWLGTIILLYIAFYILTLRCLNPDCKKPQIYRGVHPSNWRFPEDNC